MEIKVENLCKAYHGKPVLDHLNLTFSQGGAYCLMAPSGYGKTTLLHIILGLVGPDSGAVTGVESFTPAPVFQEDRLCENLSAGANIRLTARRRIGNAELEDCLAALGLPGSARTAVRELSGGMKRRVAIARALMSGGDLLVLDEPFRGLDKTSRDRVIDFVRENTVGKTVLWVTHEEEECLRMGGELIRLA